MFRYAPMPGDSVTSFIIVLKLPNASFTRMFWNGVTDRAFTEFVEITNIELIANATRCRSWSGAVIEACHHSACWHGTVFVAHKVGGAAAMSGSIVAGNANCSVKYPCSPTASTC